MNRMNTLLVAALAAISLLPASAQEAGGEAVMQNILSRASVRVFLDKPVEADKVEHLLRAGMAAPTARDKRPWHFQVVRERADIERMAAANPHGGEETLATPLFIIVYADTLSMMPGMGRDFWVQDCSAATQNILLAAHALGLGAVWTSVYPIRHKVKGMQRTLGLGGRFVPLAAIRIGYPAEEPEVKDKWDETKITWGIPRKD